VRSFGLLLLLLTRVAAAHPLIAEDPPIEWRTDRAFFEWSTWVRLGVGVAQQQATAVARSVEPIATTERDAMVEGALGADVTLPLPSGRVRLGPWVELQTGGVFGGGEVLIAGSPLDMFWYKGEAVFVARAGTSGDRVTGALAYGYRCPWRLAGPYSRVSRYEIGVRFVASVTRAIANSDEWSASFGLEFEPVGALRYIAAIESWY